MEDESKSAILCDILFSNKKFLFFFWYSWLYRMRPSVFHLPFEKMDSKLLSNNWNEIDPNPNQVAKYLLIIFYFYRKKKNEIYKKSLDLLFNLVLYTDTVDVMK